MNKDTHICLARYLIDNLEAGDLIKHKRAFCFGSILPDCLPTFLIKKHNMGVAFEELKEQIIKITDDYEEEGITTYFCRHLGVTAHYLADFFTYPHNSGFRGSLKAHVDYESKLEWTLGQYLLGDHSDLIQLENRKFGNAQEICDYILEMHDAYQKSYHHIGIDCSFILELCAKVIGAILRLFEIKLMKKKTVCVQAA